MITDANINVDSKTDDGSNALHMAAENDQVSYCNVKKVL